MVGGTSGMLAGVADSGSEACGAPLLVMAAAGSVDDEGSAGQRWALSAPPALRPSLMLECALRERCGVALSARSKGSLLGLRLLPLVRRE